MCEEITVSVYCIAYNHEKYIRQSLDGILNQKTDFKYEVIIHDDASTDNTTRIIEEYISKYPDIIVPIIQKENQYSKGVRIFETYVLPKIRGKYIAICETDDYWCDVYKLQKQVDFLENHEGYSACVHNSIWYNCITNEKILYNTLDCDKDLELEELILYGGSEFHTSSILYKSELAHRPDFLNTKGFFDYPLSIHLALSGKVRYLFDVMSVYRWCTDGSWTHNRLGADFKWYKNHYDEIEKMLKETDKYTNGKYHELILKIIYDNDYIVAQECYKHKYFIKKNKDVFKQKPFNYKLKIYFKAYFPFIEKVVRKIKNN